jgi:ubiquinone/menaquinone biosynthesis C-methylase UbiE
MQKQIAYIVLTLFAIINSASSQERYQVKEGDPNGINKWYMGRQIANVMSHYGINWLERADREKDENSTLLVKNLDIKPGMIIADVGAGSGYYAVRMSKILTGGKIYAVDVQPEMIEYLDIRIKKDKLANIVTVLGEEQKSNLADASIDLMVLVDVYHEFSFPYEMGKSMLAALKPGGKLFMIEFRAEDKELAIKGLHKMTEEQIIKELSAAGFKFERNISNLPIQHCMVFTRPG